MPDALAGSCALRFSAVSRWGQDPWSRGAWSLLGVGAGPPSRRALGQPFGRVVIAGEATHPAQAAMVHGAFEEGQRAADWCIAEGFHDVIVVGAGAAGCGAAARLRDAGCRVRVFEARERIGGRAWSVDVSLPGAPGFAMELGANWLQQGARNTLAPIAAAAGLQLVDTDFRDPLDLGRAPRGLDATQRGAVMEALRQRVTAATPDRDLPFAEVFAAFLAEPAPFARDTVQHVVDTEVFLDTGAPLGLLSARHAFEPGVGEGDRWIREGYGRVLASLLEGVDLRIAAPVERIDWREADGVRVHCGGARPAERRAEAVIVTVPAAVLRGDSPCFDPPLPAAQRAALDGIITGRVEKAAMVFAERFWPCATSAYLRITDGPGRVSEWLDLTEATGVPAITGIFVGDWAAELWDGHSDAEVASAVSAVLARASAAAQGG